MSFTIRKEQSSLILGLVGLNERLVDLAAAFRSMAPSPELGVAEKVVAQVTEKPASPILRATLLLSSLRLASNAQNAESFVATLSEGLKSEDWSSEDLTNLRSWSEQLWGICDSPAVVALAKTLDLSFASLNMLTSARILTDVRPVFDREATKVEVAVVVQTLEISYTGSHGRETLQVGVDRADLENLEEACRRARRKLDLSKAITTVPTAANGDNNA